MTWQLYAIAALGILVLAVVAGVVSMLGMDTSMAVGLAAGAGLSFPLMWFSHRNLKRAVNAPDKGAMMGHIYGGFGLRLVVLVVGFFALAFSGLGSPAGFTLAFMAGIVLSLGWQALSFAKETTARQALS